MPKEKLHFIGIGGIGMSALARICAAKGYEISGSNNEENQITEALQSERHTVHIGHNSENLPENSAVIYSAAIPADNPERKLAAEKNLNTFSYPEFVGKLFNEQKLIAIAGTHGKTTTTAMVAVILDAADKDPTALIGSIVKNYNSNARIGKSEYVVLEADEYKQAFHNYKPQVIALTNIEFDHPDCYKDLEEVKDAFKTFIANSPDEVIIIANKDDKNIAEILQDEQRKIFWYAVMSESEFTVANSEIKNTQQHFTIQNEEFIMESVGVHNIYNAAAAITLAHALEIPVESIKQGIANFKGTWRRFDIQHESSDLVVIDDYAHHPTEINVTIQAAKMKYQNRRVIAVLQPHHQERTKELMSDFTPALYGADEIILTDIYEVAGRESNEKISLEPIYEELQDIHRHVQYIQDKEDIPNAIKKIYQKGDVVLMMGAGDINNLTQKVIKKLT